MKQAEKYYVVVNGEKTEVSQQVYNAYYQEERKEKYIAEKDSAHNVVPLNISGMEELEASQVCFTPAIASIEDQVASQEVQTCLHQCIASLPRAERELVQALYFEGMTEKAYAREKIRSSCSNPYHFSMYSRRQFTRSTGIVTTRLLLGVFGGVINSSPLTFW